MQAIIGENFRHYSSKFFSLVFEISRGEGDATVSIIIYSFCKAKDLHVSDYKS